MEHTGLKCLFRGSIAQSGTNVYFCCHEEDLPLYLNTLSEDILDRAPNAIIWYRDPDTPPADDFYDMLREMCLFLVPVTARFVYSENAARLSDLPFAEDHRIPVLPVLLENGLAEEFNSRCGNMHLLNRIPGDPLAPPYGPEMDKFLSRIIIGDNLAQRIQQVFRCYIFLSYRKTDVQHARRVMQLIHDIDFCRDTAIWYDAFLTPGMDFNNSIQDAMLKSRLFTMVITPSITQAGNYVMKTEYPAAISYGMPIVPIETVPTDKQALSDFYPGIPDPFSAEDISGIRRALADWLSDQIPEPDPMRDYLIGVAHLRGFDMETDPRRALRLIRSAAEAGLPEACGQLVHMYYAGDGVARDYREAARWQQYYVNILKDSCDGSEARLLELYRQTGELWNFYYESQEAEAAAQVSRELQQIALRLLEAGSPEGHRAMAAGLKSAGNEAERLGNFQEAERLAGCAVDSMNTYLREKRGQQIDHLFPAEFWNALDRLADVLEYRGKYPEAENACMEALRFADHMVLTAPISENRLLLIRSYIRLADLFMHSHRLPEAEELFRHAIALLEKEGKQDYAQTIATILARLGEIYRVQLCFTEAEAKLMEAADLLKTMEQRPDARRDLHHVYKNMYDLYISSGNLAEAKKICIRMLELDESLEGLVSPTYIRELLTDDLILRGTLCLDEKHYWQSVPYFRQAEALSREKAETDFSGRLNLAQALLGQAKAARFTGNLPTALNYYQEGTRILEALPSESVIPLVQKQRAEAHGWLGQQLVTAGKLPEAAEQLCKAIALKEQFLTETDAADYHRSLGRDQLFLGQVYLRQGLKKEAITVCRQGLGQLTRAYELFRKPEAAQDLSTGLRQTAEMYQAMGIYPDAIKMYLRSADIAAEARLPAAGPMQAVCHFDCARLYLKLGRQEEAVIHLQYAQRVLPLQLCADPRLRQIRMQIDRLLAQLR